MKITVNDGNVELSMGIAYSIAVATCVSNLFNFRHQNVSTQVNFFLAIASFFMLRWSLY